VCGCEFLCENVIVRTEIKLGLVVVLSVWVVSVWGKVFVRTEGKLGLVVLLSV
jgi:hypothetical protein